MKKRIFLGIKIGAKLYPPILRWRKKYPGKLSVRWIKEENLHITLLPPWYEESSNIKNQILKIEKIIPKINPFLLKFNYVGYGPENKRPRLIWAEGESPKEIMKLKNGLEKIILIKPQSRDFKLHLTLARFRPKDFKKFSINKINDKVFWEQIVDSFCLFESRLSPKGAEYKILKKFNLQSQT